MTSLQKLLLCTCVVLSHAVAQTSVSLGSTGSFAVLAGGGVGNTGASKVTGNIGAGPGNSVTGFSSATVTGAIHSGDSVSAQAMTDLNTAFSDAAGRAQSASVSGDVGGQTLTSGVYNSSSALAISNGNLTLDAKGNASAVFIFQIAGNLTTAAGRQVVLAGGATSANVFWQVSGTVSLGALSAIRGTVMAAQAVTLSTGATVEGRVFSQTQAVTMDTVTITTPVPAIYQGGVVNGASFTAPVVAGSIATVFGQNLAYGQQQAFFTPLPTTLAGASFQVSGQAIPLFYASSNQVNIQVPWELAGQTTAQISGQVGVTPIPGQTFVLAATAPAIFQVGASQQGAVLIANTSILAASASVAAGARPVHPGEYVSIYCTGLGPVSNAPATGAAASLSVLSNTNLTPTVSIGGVTTPATFSGLAPGLVGAYQVNAQVPLSAPLGSAVPVTITIGGATSNAATIAINQ
jgi:uncharacterized protein (TIGR03437 family)